jgi:capsular polysaccharide synthesis protein
MTYLSKLLKLWKKDSVQAFWEGEKLSPLAVASISSFLKRGIKFSLYSYDQLLSVPRGVKVEDATKIIAKSEIFVVHGGYEHFSDLFRYELLKKRGGWWVDTDILLNQSSVPDVDYFFSTEEDKVLCGAVLKFPPGSDAAARLMDRARSINWHASEWGASGPTLLTDFVTEEGLLGKIRPRHECYEIHWLEVGKLVLPEFCAEVKERLRKSEFVHLYNSVLRNYNGFNAYEYLPPRGSYLREVYDNNIGNDLLSELKEMNLSALRATIRNTVNSVWWRERAEQVGVRFDAF